MKVLISHGTLGSPESNWFPWLSEKLRKDGHSVLVPAYPTPGGQSFESWLKVFEENIGFNNLDRETVLIGHSLGAAFSLRVLEESKASIKACFLVAGFVQKLELEEFDKLNLSFIEYVFDWPKIRSNCHRFEIFHGANDPYVPLPMAQEIATELDININIVPDGKHLNAEAGMTSFPLLYQQLCLI